MFCNILYCYCIIIFFFYMVEIIIYLFYMATLMLHIHRNKVVLYFHPNFNWTFISILISCDNQLGFKKNVSMDMCIFFSKQIVHYYVRKSNPVYVCFIDASKAYDRVNHYKLFGKMLKCGVSIFVVKLIMYWYSQQTFHVQWGNFFFD